MKKIFFPVFLSGFFLLAGCSKLNEKNNADSNQELNSGKAGLQQGNTVARENEGCTSFSLLTNQGGGNYLGNYAGIPLNVSNISYQTYYNCPPPHLIPVTNGLPAGGNLSTSHPLTQVLVQPQTGSSSGSNQFVLYEGYATSINWNLLSTQIQNYQEAWNTYVSDTTGTITAPYISDFVTGSSISSGRYIYGKLIRVTTGSGFAFAPVCFTHISTSCIIFPYVGPY